MKKTFAIFLLLLSAISAQLWLTPSSEAANTSFLAAALQFNPVLKERDRNIEELAKAVEKAAQNGAKLIVAPEMSTTGYQYNSREEIAPYTDTIPGVATDIIGKVAKKHNVYVVFGMAERDKDTGLFYNAAAFVGPKGYIGKYRKSHQWEAEEHWATWGDVGVPVYDTELGRIAIIICMDATYFETSRLAALGGADILAFPTNSTAQAMWALQSRAVQNGFYIVAANRSNTELNYHMIGASAVWSPTGELLNAAAILPTSSSDINEANAIYARIDPAKFNNVNKKRMCGERRPEMYKDIALHIAPWNYQATQNSEKVRAFAVQYAPIKFDKKANRAKINKLLAEDKTAVDLVVLPEYTLTEMPLQRKDAVKLSESVDGETAAYYKDIAKQRKAFVVGGIIETDGENLYNTTLLISPDGTLAGKYRKTHLSKAEKLWASNGDRLGLFVTPKWRLGIMNGYEATFPEIAGLMAVKRADIIALPACWNGEYGCVIDKSYSLAANPYPANSMCLFDAVALTSQAYPIIANFTGEKYLGGSGIYALDPLYGLDKVSLLTKEESALKVTFATLQKDWWFNQEKLIGGRNPHMYKPIVIDK